MSLRFDISARDPRTRARVGRIFTAHGVFDTPAFMPVGTRGSLKGLLPSTVRETGTQCILGNTYHLLLRPGPDAVRELGGLHRFMGWDGPILTDSGGFQAFSLSAMNRISDEGVVFKSVVDGSLVELTPERATQVQNALGADIIMAFDDCPPSVAAPKRMGSMAAPAPALPADHAARLRTANERTVRWLERCKSAHARAADQSLFGIVQGGTDLDLRAWCAERITAIDLPGYAIGGVAVGESTDDIERVVSFTAPLLPERRPRYLMGVGYARDIVAAVRAGIDMFDCVLPTRNGRNATAFTATGPLRFRNAVHAGDQRPIEPGCDCHACAWWLRENPRSGDVWTGLQPPLPDAPAASTPAFRDSTFSRAYIRHLFLSDEMLGPILLSIHNVRFYQRLMADLRATIAAAAREPARGGGDDGAGRDGGAGDDGEAWRNFRARWPVAFAATPVEAELPGHHRESSGKQNGPLGPE